MRRREFIKVIAGSAAAWSLAAFAQDARTRRIGVLSPFTANDPEEQARNSVFEQSLQQLGWAIGRDLQIDYRSSGGDAMAARRYAAELVALAPDHSNNSDRFYECSRSSRSGLRPKLGTAGR